MKKYIFIASIILLSNFCKSQNLQVSLTLLTPPCTNNGVVQINVTGGVAPYNYNFGVWPYNSTATPTITNNIISGLAPGNLYVYVSDASGLGGSNDLIIPPPFQSTVVASPAVCPNLGQINVTNSGSGPFLTELYLNGSLVSSTAPFTNLQPNIYLVKTTDMNGCFVINDSVNVENISGLNLNMASSNVTCQGGTLTVNVTGGMPPYSYLWSSGNSIGNVMNGPLGYYNVEVNDAQGCTDMINGNLYSPTVIQSNAVVAPTTCPNSTGSINIFPSGGTPPYTCTWNNGSVGNSLANLNTGVYIVTMVDAAGCFNYDYLYVNSLSPIYTQLFSTASSCLSPTGSANMVISNGTPPYSVQWFTNPPQTGLQMTNVNPGEYAFEVTDASGCVFISSVYVGNTDPIQAYPNSTPNTCGQNNGAIYLNANGNNLSYLWSNGATTENIYNLDGGNYTCLITNASGCTKTTGAYVNTSSPFSISTNITNASCIFTADGQINLNITGGTPPYNVQWSNGNTGLSNNNIGAGDYYASISDANGCNFSYHFDVDYNSTSPCACTLSGKVFFDANNNCLFDANEVPLSNVNVQLNNGVNNSYSITNNDGDYHFFVPIGTYTLQQLPYQHFAAGGCTSNPIIVNANGGINCSIINNFADTAPVINDLYTNFINIEPAVVGYGYKQRIIVKNNGTSVANNTMVNVKGSNYAGLLFSTFAGSIVSGTPNWNFNNLPSLNIKETFSFDLTYQVESTTPTNTLLYYADTVQKSSQPWVLDETPWNNVCNLPTYTVASLDPNYKEVSPKGFGPNGDINFSDSILTYTVHFENTGTYFAYNIEIVDTISNNLDINSLEMIYGSHPFVAEIDENRALHIKFNNIMLSWDEATNKGFVVYTIKIKRNLPVGSRIKNTAYIYFDFNEAVITNTTVNTLVINAGMENLYTSELKLFPNPANHYFILSNHKNAIQGKIEIIDLLGKVWLTYEQQNEVNSVTIDGLSDLPNGLYLVNYTDKKSKKVNTIKFAKME
ncbi:MAG TPA: T9SS type A sorting domain-containing protein [Bacteroidia bacterium]|nr:T9SS type A sorting domain-containing protein [Bacteroidia bacterium]